MQNFGILDTQKNYIFPTIFTLNTNSFFPQKPSQFAQIPPKCSLFLYLLRGHPPRGCGKPPGAPTRRRCRCVLRASVTSIRCKNNACGSCGFESLITGCPQGRRKGQRDRVAACGCRPNGAKSGDGRGTPRATRPAVLAMHYAVCRRGRGLGSLESEVSCPILTLTV